MSTLFQSTINLKPLRKWQARTIPLIKDSIRAGHRRIMVMAPTGSGKTRLAAELFSGALAKGNNAIFAMPDLSLIEQTLKSFDKAGFSDMGVIQGDHERTNWGASLQIASIRTLVNRKRPDAAFIIQDEAHVKNKAFWRMIESGPWKDIIVIGLSATPWSQGLGLHYDDLIIGTTIRECIEDGILCPFEGFEPDTKFDRKSLKESRTSLTGYDDDQSSAVMRSKEIIGETVETWKRYWGKPRTFQYCVDLLHAQAERDAFLNAGIPWGYIDGTMDKDQRERVFEQFRAEKIMGIASVGTLIRGIDEDVRCIYDRQPKNSEIMLVQEDGRGLRMPPDDPNKVLMIIDSCGNRRALGTALEIFHDTLDCRDPGSKKKAYEGDKEPPKPRKCPKCHALIASYLYRCPKCGEKISHKSSVEVVKGDLVRFGEKPHKPTMADKQRFYSELIGLAKERGKSEKWVLANYRAKFKVWPRKLNDVAATPSMEVRRFDHERRMEYFKAHKEVANGD